MRFKLTSLGVLLGLFAIGLPTIGNAAQIVTLKDAINIALEQNKSLRQARNNAALGTMAVSEAWMRFIPSLSISATGSQGFEHQFEYSDKRTSEDKAVTFGASSGLNLFNGFRDVKALRLAKLSKKAGDLGLELQEQSTAISVVSQFLGFVQSQQQLAVQQQNLAAALELQRQIEIYVDKGDRPRADLYAQQSAVASARLSVIDTQGEIQLARMALINTLQLDSNVEYEFQAPDTEIESSIYMPATFDENSVKKDSPELERLIQHALSKRKDFEIQQIQAQSVEISAPLVRPSRWPTVSLGARYGSGYFDDVDTNFTDQFDLNRSGALSLSIVFPIINFDTSRRFDTRRIRLQIENSKMALEQARQDIELQVRRAWLNYNIARERYKLLDVQKKTAELALETAKERYQIGAASLVELTQARASYLQSESSRINARYGMLLQRLTFEAAIGDLEPRSIIP